jgi:hypothetical protein
MEKRLPVTRYVSKYFPQIIDAKNIAYSTFGERLDAARRIMEKEGKWFEDGHNYGFQNS